MSLIPKTTCSRCHRQYPSTRQSCPYCGEKKPRELNRTIPEADSAVRGTQANARSGENLNWQMLFGTVLVVAVLAAVIVMVSSGINKDISGSPSAAQNELTERAELAEETEKNSKKNKKKKNSDEEETAEESVIPGAAATAVPTATPEPTPVPTEAPLVTSLAITYNTYDEPGFTQYVGDKVQLDAAFYPINNELTVTWSSSDESVAIVDQTGLVTLVGPGQCNVYAEVGGLTDVCEVISRD